MASLDDKPMPWNEEKGCYTHDSTPAHSRAKPTKLTIKIGESTAKFILQALLLLGVVIVASSGHDGWGWLVFILILSML